MSFSDLIKQIKEAKQQNQQAVQQETKAPLSAGNTVLNNALSIPQGVNLLLGGGDKQDIST